MKPISSRPIFTLSLFATKNHKIIKNSQFLAFTTQAQQNPISSHHHRRHDEESRAVRVSVWWDFENCSLPWNTNVFRVGQCITNALRANGIKGPIQITAFGDVMQISRTNQEALSSTGINLSHVPSGGKNSADRSLLVDLMYWVSQNPPPAHLFLISGDRDFAGILHRLRMSNYNILLASPNSAPSVLCSAATIMWQWSSLLKGEDLTGKLFNQPPEGPYNSWYGHYKLPLEDPFLVNEQSQSSSCGVHADEASELASESKVRPIPKEVTRHVRQILNSYPEGVSIMQLRTELKNSNLLIDKDFYGHKKFSRFLLAMPRVLKLNSSSDGQFLVQVVNSKFLDANVEPVIDNGESKIGSVSKANGRRSSCEGNMQRLKMESGAINMEGPEKDEQEKESSTKRNTQEIREQKRKIKLQEQLQKVEEASPLVEIKDLSERNENQMSVPYDISSTSEIGIFKKIWMKLFGNGDGDNTDKNCLKDDEALSGKNITEDKTLISRQSSESICPALFSPSSHEALLDSYIARSDIANVSSQDSRFFNQIMSLFKFWGSQELNEKLDRNGETADQVKVNSEQLDIFSKESLWNELESFIDSSQGSASFSQSRNREHLVQNLQNQGPPLLKSLSKSDLLHLVDLLISDKKWIEECHSQQFPFKITRPSKDPRNNDPPPFTSNGLSQIFSGKQQSLHELGERKHQNPPHTGVPQPLSHRDSSSKPGTQLLADCQKLVDHILKEYPEGFNMGAFRKLFLEKHGYALDLQKLGYDKLANLLQVMPGVRIESNLIFPAAALKSLDLQNTNLPIQSDSQIVSTKDDDSDSWDELGPVNNSGPKKVKLDATLTNNYEPLREEDFSDSEEETPSVRSENEVKSISVGESSLLQILDSWYSGKGGDAGKDKLMSTTNDADGTTIGSQVCNAPPGAVTKNESSVVKPIRKRKPVKSYSFVTEQPVFETKDGLVDGILGSLKENGEKSADSRLLG